MHALKTCASTALRHASRRGYATVSSGSAYSQTIPNLRINSETKVIFQGFTGKLSIAGLQVDTADNEVQENRERKSSFEYRYSHPL